jgi:hypothetical protein
MAEVSLYLRVRMADGSQKDLKPVMLDRKNLIPLWAFVNGKPTHCPTGVYQLRVSPRRKTSLGERGQRRLQSPAAPT